MMPRGSRSTDAVLSPYRMMSLLRWFTGERNHSPREWRVEVQVNVGGFVDQERDGFREYVAARQDSLLRLAWFLTTDWALAEDLVQVALVKAWRRWHALGPGDPDGYVRRIVINTYATWWRRRWRGEVPTVALPEPARSDPGYAAVEQRDHLTRMLAALPRRQRATIALRYYEGLSEQETAAALGVSVGAVKAYANRGLTALRLTSQAAAKERDDDDERAF